MRLVLVGGMYKSGTSACCAAWESLGYRNPRTLTNGGEMGHGIAVALYPTRECSIARELNRKLIASAPRAERSLTAELRAYLADMSQELGPDLVIKDPCLKLTALQWVRAARLLGASEVRLVTTSRSPAKVHESLGNSRFMTWKAAREPALMRELAQPLSPALAAQLVHLGGRLQVARYMERQETSALQG